MKIIISPSKTKQLQGQGKSPLFNEAITKALLTHMQALSVEDIGKALKLKADKAGEVKDFYGHYETAPSGCAVESYSGLAFKNLDWAGLSPEGKAFGEKHLLILSGFYGIVMPTGPVKDYRLDFVDTIFKVLAEKDVERIYSPLDNLKAMPTTLYELWSPSINAYVADEDIIFNLASKEYSSIIVHEDMVTIEFVEFKKDAWRAGSTSSKQMRGRMVHYMLEKAVMTVDDLPETFEGYEKHVLEDGRLISYRKA